MVEHLPGGVRMGSNASSSEKDSDPVSYPVSGYRHHRSTTLRGPVRGVVVRMLVGYQSGQELQRLHVLLGA